MNILSKGKEGKANFDAEVDHVQALLGEGKQQAKKSYYQGKDQAENVYNQAKESIHDLYESGKKTAEQAQDVLKGYSNELVSMVKDKPLSSLLIASAIGYLVSALIRRK